MPDGVFQDIHAKEINISGSSMILSSRNGSAYISGSLGIGTSTPENKLHIHSTSGNQIKITNPNGNAVPIWITNTQNEFSSIDWNRDPISGTFADTGRTHTRILSFNGISDSYITFSTSPTNNTTATEAMRITANKILNIKENITHPASAPTGEGNLFVSGGALIYLGTSGTTTVVGTA